MDDNTPINALDLPARTHNALYRAGYHTFGQLRALDPRRNPLGPLLIPGVGLKGESAVILLLRDVERAEQAEAPKPGSGSDGLAEEVDRPMTKDERKYETGRFLTWLVHHDDGLVFVRGSAEGHQRHEVDPESDFDALYRRFLDYEEDQGVAAMEAQAEQAYERSWGG